MQFSLFELLILRNKFHLESEMHFDDKNRKCNHMIAVMLVTVHEIDHGIPSTIFTLRKLLFNLAWNPGWRRINACEAQISYCCISLIFYVFSAFHNMNSTRALVFFFLFLMRLKHFLCVGEEKSDKKVIHSHVKKITFDCK